MPAADFVNLHVHTEYSMLDGAARLSELFAETERLGQRALGITDHGYMFGAYDFYKHAQDAGIKPIIGLEAYVTPGTSRFDRSKVRWGAEGQVGDDVSAGGAYTHMTLWAMDNTGMHNLFRLASLASIEGHYYKPRVDVELLQRYAKGIIGTTGCPSGEVQTRLRLGQYAEALKAAGQMQDIFGREFYFVELMDHGLELERRVKGDLLQIAADLGAPLVATNDSHYTRQDQAAAHELLLCIQSNSLLSDPTYEEGGRRFAFSGDDYYLKSAERMRTDFADLPEACDNTLLIAEMCNATFVEEVGRYMPHFPLPDGVAEDDVFREQVLAGLVTRYPGGITEAIRARADYEIDVITSKGYAGYYLVVADFINWAKAQGIRVGPGRGSGAGSIAAYAMGITELDPLEHGLLFERFLNPERMSMPDFDVDFDERRRGEVIAYVQAKYGSDRVAQIVTYGTIKAKQALRDAARVLGHPYAKGDQLSKAMPPPVQGADISLAEVFEPSHERYAEGAELRALEAADPDAKEIIAAALGIENLKRQWGVHAAGVIISNTDLLDVIPIMKREQDGAIITQIDFPDGENLGLVKMDFLGLRNLTILDDALRNIERNEKEPVVLETLPLDDVETYRMISRAETLGVFQLDGTGMRNLLRLMRPDSFADIIATGALYRPGPMGANSHNNYALRKNKLQVIEPIHPELAEPLAEILSPTYGLIVYQEQVLQIAREVAGYSLAQADLLRKAMGKKSKEILDSEFIPFRDGMRANGFSDDAIQTLWNVLVPFSAYAFNKAHAAAYGLVSYWTAYLKAHYPVEYMAALLTSVRDDKAKSAVYLAECRRMGITVLPPDINTSVSDFTAVGGSIRFGLTAVRNVGPNVVDAIVAARKSKGDFTSFDDFLAKVPAVVCNKRTIESLIKAGAFDTLGATRRALLAIHEQAVDAVMDVKRSEAVGQFDLFGDDLASPVALGVSVPDLAEWDAKTLLGFEREMLGQYVSAHPLDGLATALASECDTSIAALLADEQPSEGTQVRLAGLVTAVELKMSKQGKPWASFTLEDFDGSIDINVFGRVYEEYSPLLVVDRVIGLRARVRARDEGLSLSANELWPLNLTATSADEPLAISMAVNRCIPVVVDELKDILQRHPGETEVQLRLVSANRNTVVKLDDSLRVTRSTALFADLKALLGPSCLTTS
jgi:DNA polymerase-3 subunit alpha